MQYIVLLNVGFHDWYWVRVDGDIATFLRKDYFDESVNEICTE